MFQNILGCTLIFTVSILLAWPVGLYMSKVYKGQKSLLDFFAPLERFIFRICRIDPTKEMDSKQYLVAIFIINAVWLVYGFVVLLVQGSLFLNPAHNPSMDWSLALNSAVSFITSTNLQHYSGETGTTYLSQLSVFMFLQFVSAATSLAAGVAVVRGLASNSLLTLGNFYSDFVKSCTRILLPICIVATTIFMFNGMPMTFNGPDKVTSIQGDSVQVATGPVAAMISIKELGSNGGGFFGANSAHPFENPNFFTYIIHLLLVLLLPIAFLFFIGEYLNHRKFAFMLFGVMLTGFILTTIPIILSETGGNLHITSLGINQMEGNMEGKEARYGSFYSAFYTGINVNIPAGSVTAVHDSYMPLSDIAMLIAMQVDAFFGGPGTGWINMFMYLIVAVFVASLMIGRTPELLGRKLSLPEIQVAVAVNIISCTLPIIMAAIACFVYANYPSGGDTLGWLSNKGPHGFTTMYYEYVSANAGNGSEFSGLGNNTLFWNLSTCITMLFGRYLPIIGALAIIGSYRTKIFAPPSLGSLKVETNTFGIFLFAIIFILTVLSKFIAVILGPLMEHFKAVSF